MAHNLLIKESREAAGLTQRDLAASSGISQPTIAAFETGSRDVTTSTFDRLVHGLGLQVSVLPAGYLTAARTAVLVAKKIEREGGARAEVLVLQLADDLAAAEPALRGALTITPAPPTGDKRFDAWIAGLVEYRLEEVGIAPPNWVRGERRSLGEEWIVGGVTALADLVRSETPEPLLRRGVLLSEADLVSV